MTTDGPQASSRPTVDRERSLSVRARSLAGGDRRNALAGVGELSPQKLALFVATFMLIFVIVPGGWAEVERVPPSTRGFALLLAALFVLGCVLACAVAGRLPSARPGRASPAVRAGLWALAGILAVQAVYITLAGPVPPILAASMGYDPLAVAILREDAIKLNPDAFFVRAYVTARDVTGPVTVMLSVQALARPRSERLRWAALAALLPAIYVAIWSSQKATLINYALATLIFVARDARHLISLSLKALLPLVMLVFAMFLITYPGFFDVSTTGDDGAAASVLEGLIARLFVGPLEVSMAYIDALDNARLIDPIDALPIIGPWLHPGRDSIENVVGRYYFFTGIESISANAMCFAYAYLVGGTMMTFLAGAGTAAVLLGMQSLVRLTGSGFAAQAYAALCCYLLLDLLTGNVFSYLLNAVKWGLIAFLVGAALNTFVPARRPKVSVPSRLG